MALCRETIEGALRKLGKLGAGRSGRMVDLETGLEALKGYYRQKINEGAFGRLRDVVPVSAYTAGENERIFRNTEDVTSVSLPELVEHDWLGTPAEYGSRWQPPATEMNPNRPPKDCSVVVVNDSIMGQTRSYIYDGQRNEWVAIDDLTLDDTAPLSHRDPLGLSSTLAVQMADEWGADIHPVTLSQAAAFQSSLVHRWSMPRRQVVGSYM